MKDVKPIPAAQPGALPVGSAPASADKSAKPAAPDAKPVPAQQPAGNAPIQHTPVPEAAKK
jgi:hypothetical protein